MIDDQNYELFIAINECMALSIIKQNTMWRHLLESASSISSILESSTFWHSRSLYERL